VRNPFIGNTFRWSGASVEPVMSVVTKDTKPVSHRRRSYAFLLVANALWVFALLLYSSFISLYIRGLGAYPVEVGSYSTVLTLNLVIWIALGGPLTTRFGEKRILILSWVITVPAPLIYLTAPTWHWTLLGAILEGVSGVGWGPLWGYMSHVTGLQHRGLSFTLLSASSAVGGIAAPTLGGLLISGLGYPLVFLLAALLYGVSTLLVLPITPIPRSADTPSRRWRGGFLSNRVFLLATLLWATIMTLVMLANAFVPLYLEDQFGLQEAQIGVLVSVFDASGALLGPLLGMAGDRWGHTTILPLPIIGTLGFFGALVLAPNLLFLPGIYALYGVTYATGPLLIATLSKSIPENEVSSGVAVFSCLGRSLTPIAPLLGGVGYALLPALPLGITSLALPIPLAILLLLRRAQRLTTELEP
jgi:MFS family permease